MAHTTEELLFGKMMQFGREARKNSPCPHGKPGYPHGPRPEGHGRGHYPHGMLSRERILTVLLKHEKGLRQKQLMELMGVNASTMSEFITRLEDGGYIIRSVDPEDKRATLITLTEKGRARAYELQDERQERLRYLFRNLTEEEKTELLRLLRKVMTPDTEDLFPPERSVTV